MLKNAVYFEVHWRMENEEGDVMEECNGIWLSLAKARDWAQNLLVNDPLLRRDEEGRTHKIRRCFANIRPVGRTGRAKRCMGGAWWGTGSPRLQWEILDY
jgi:hypothetical protein